MNKQKVVVISSYPSKELIHDSYVGGVASYAKNTLLSLMKLKKTTKLDITVIGDKINQHTDYVQENIRVKRIWRKNSLITFPKIIKELIQQHRSTSTVVVEFEHQMFGGPLTLLPFPIFLLTLKLLKKRVIVVCHQVIPDMNDIGPHINIKTNSSKAILINSLLSTFYRLLILTSSKVIVFEENLRQRLSKYGDKHKIVTIAHGVQKFDISLNKKNARKRLNITSDKFVILLFGFLGWYKGTDWVVDAIKKIKNQKKNQKIELIVAGGPNPNLENKDHYINYIKGVKNLCENEGIQITGFVPEKDIPLYYAATDLVVLPYRSFMSASGPLSLALSFKKPFLLSPKLKPVMHMPDMQEEMKKLKIKDEDIHFKDFNGDFSKKISRLERNRKLRQKLSIFSRKLSEKRNWDIIGNQYYHEIVN